VADIWYCYDVEVFARIERILGKSEDAATYDRLAQGIRDAFNRTFLDPKTGEYANGTQAANAMALFLNLVPDESRHKVVGNLTNDVLYYHDTHVTTGFIGVKFLMTALTATGHADLAYDLATQTTYPSWGFMIAKGATTLWELWQDKTGPSMNSHNHIMFGSVGAWLYRALGGINLDADGEGYRRIVIQPQIVRDLTSAGATVETVRGTVSCTWTHSAGKITLDVAIPVNSEAKIVIPKDYEMTEVVIKEGDRVVWQNGGFVPGDEGILNATAGAKQNSFRGPVVGSVVFEVGSGHYSFELTGL
jgi:alpha-L-rhamnosidase